MAKKVQEINATSVADIAFLLLVFFLVTTTMDTDSGLLRKLAPLNTDIENVEKINERNIFLVLININDEVGAQGRIIQVNTLKDKVKEFLLNRNMDENMPEILTAAEKLKVEQSKEGEKRNPQKIKQWQEVVNELGASARYSKGVVSLQNDRTTTYGKYIEVQNEIVAAYNEVRNDLCKKHYGKNFDELDPELDEKRIDVIKTLIPLTLSEAEPRNIQKNR